MAGPIAIRVGVEHRLQIRLQVAPGDLLGDTVGDRGNAQRARATVCLRNIDPPHRRRKIAPRRQPVPELVEVVRKITLEVCNRLCVYPSRSLVGLHTFESFPDFPLGDVKRLCLAHGLLPSPVGPWPWLNNAAPSVQLHYRAFIPTTSCSAPAPLRYSGPCGVCRLDVSLGIGATGSHVPYKSLVELRAAYMPDAARAGFRVLPS